MESGTSRGPRPNLVVEGPQNSRAARRIRTRARRHTGTWVEIADWPGLPLTQQHEAPSTSRSGGGPASARRNQVRTPPKQPASRRPPEASPVWLRDARTQYPPERSTARPPTAGRPSARSASSFIWGADSGRALDRRGRADFPSADTPTRTPRRESTRTLTGRRHVEGQGDQCSDGEVATPMV
ncbi:MAG: hypothetical protein QOD62_2223 [Actinomycetota bacterium]|nr:hypothetical protein [Actinomycetota bacterium]